MIWVYHIFNIIVMRRKSDAAAPRPLVGAERRKYG